MASTVRPSTLWANLAGSGTRRSRRRWIEANDAPADQSRDEAAADGLDLGQLGHAQASPLGAAMAEQAVPTRTWVAPSRTAVS